MPAAPPQDRPQSHKEGDDVNWERWGRAAGVAFVVFTIASFIVGGEPPKVGDPAADVVSYFDGDRGQVLLSSFLFAVALGFWIWFGGTLANSLRERGEGTSRRDDHRRSVGVRGGAASRGRCQRDACALRGASGRGRRRASTLQSDVGPRHGCRDTECGLLSSRVSGTQADTHDSSVVECGRHWCCSSLHPSKHELGDGRLLVANRRVPLHLDTAGAPLDLDYEHRSRSQDAGIIDGATSGDADDVGTHTKGETRVFACHPRATVCAQTAAPAQLTRIAKPNSLSCAAL
jgi:hypothetical protein